MRVDFFTVPRLLSSRGMPSQVFKRNLLHLLKTRGRAADRHRPSARLHRQAPGEEYPLLPEYEHLTMQLAHPRRGFPPSNTPSTALKTDRSPIDETDRPDRRDEDRDGGFLSAGWAVDRGQVPLLLRAAGKIVKRHSDAFSMCRPLASLALLLRDGQQRYAPEELLPLRSDGDEYILTPAYDLLLTNLILPEDQEAPDAARQEEQAEKGRFCLSGTAVWDPLQNRRKTHRPNRQSSKDILQAIEQSFLPKEAQKAYKALIAERIGRLS